MNTTILIGRLTKDPEIAFIPNSGMGVCNFSIAVDDVYKGEKTTDFFNCTVFGKSAENLVNYKGKGALLAIEGKLKNQTYEKDGIKRTVTKVMVNNLKYLDSKNKGNSDSFGKEEGIVEEEIGEDMPF